MSDNKTQNNRIGAALVVGGGIGGMQASLDLAESGIKVYLVDNKSSIGGKMSQLDKTFPTNDCAMCTMAPRLVEVGRNKDIELITLSEVEEIKGEPGHFKVVLKQKARYVDEEKCTGCGECEEDCPITVPDDFNMKIGETKAINRRYPQAIPNAFAIEKLGQSPCRYSCPIGQKVQGYIALIKEKRYEDAFHVILRDNPFPSVCGRVCKHYCEAECTRGQVDEPVSIMNLKRFISDWAYAKKLSRKDRRPDEKHDKNKSKRVAIIGAGPAGLTAARDLTDWGYPTTVFESHAEPGGMVRFGVPEYRLPKERLQWDLDNILGAGIELKTNHKIKNIDYLFNSGFHAVFIATGAHAGRALPIPGNDLKDVLIGTEFLRGIALREKIQIKEKVLVLGSGNVAMDVARTAVRSGAKTVQIACLESREALPADPWEIEEAEKEGISIFPSRTFLKIFSKNGCVTGVQCAKIKFHGFDENGSPAFDIFEGSEHIIEADTVIFAIGQIPEIPFSGEGIELTKFRTIKVNEETLETSKPGVFAGGDVVTGTKFIVDAISAGHRAARSIDRFLNGKDLAQTEPSLSKVELSDIEIKERIQNEGRRLSPFVLSIEERKKSFAECTQSYTEEMALAEAERCLECGICSECLLCLENCSADAIDHGMMKERFRELDVGAIILSPGFDLYDAAQKKELGYGLFPNVINALQFERILSASGPFSGKVVRPSDKKTPKKIAFIQCVGSRDHERDYCSAVCCMYATKEAIVAKEHVGEELECDIFYMDMRAYGKGFEEYYQRARELGIHYIRCRPPLVEEISQTQNLLIKYVSEDAKKVSGEYDLVILSTGMTPPKSAIEIAEKFNIELNQYNFCLTSPFKPVESTREGIYVSGSFTEPKDIPETVMQASGAASKVLSLLADVRGSHIIPTEYPPELDVRNQEPKIGVFVCHCGTNIASVVDVPAVVNYAKTLPNVVYAENNLYTCSNNTQERIKEKIEEFSLNRIVVASCTPRTHESLFRNTIREAGINPYLFEMANIRDQCSWVHMQEPDKATDKTKILIRMAVAKAKLLEPLERRTISINKSALVIGGGLSGLTSAHELASQGFDVFLVEKEKDLGGNLKRIQYLFNGEDPQEELRSLVEKVKGNTKIHLFTESKIENIDGFIGNFKTTLRVKGQLRELEHGVIIVAMGAREYEPEEYYYRQDERIITQLELEERLSPVFNLWSSNKESQPHTVVMIQCVGSMDEERPYCSRVCCTEAVKNALKIKELSPETNVYILYKDIRSYGFRESLYTQAREKNVMFVRYEGEMRPKVSKNGNSLWVEVVDKTLGVPIEIPAALVVLSTGIIPHEENKTIAQLLKVPLNSDGFFLEAHLKLRPVDFAHQGVFLCGLAHSSKSIEESIIQAQAASARAARILSQDNFELEANISQVVDENCDGCAYCIDPCPYDAITLIEYMKNGSVKKTVETDETACKGCGCCQATCPKEGIFVKGFTLDQISAQIDAALGID